MWWRARRERRGNPRLLLVLLAIDAVVLGVLDLTEKSTVIYSRTVTQLLSRAESFQRVSLRVEGTLVPGSLYRLKDRCEFRFRLADKPGSADSLEVRYPVDPGYPWSPRTCGMPDTFCDAPGFEFTHVAEGELRKDASGFYVAASKVLARCPGIYQKPNGKRPAPCPPVPLRT